MSTRLGVEELLRHICRQRYSYQILVILEPILRGVVTTERLSFLIFSHKKKGDLNFSMIKGGRVVEKKQQQKSSISPPGWGVGGATEQKSKPVQKF